MFQLTTKSRLIKPVVSNLQYLQYMQKLYLENMIRPLDENEKKMLLLMIHD